MNKWHKTDPDVVDGWPMERWNLHPHFLQVFPWAPTSQWDFLWLCHLKLVSLQTFYPPSLLDFPPSVHHLLVYHSLDSLIVGIVCLPLGFTTTRMLLYLAQCYVPSTKTCPRHIGGIWCLFAYWIHHFMHWILFKKIPRVRQIEDLPSQLTAYW